MKSTGIVRKVDTLGRVVLPMELRRVMSIDVKDPIEIFMDGDRIVLAKYKPGCHLCENVSGKYVMVEGKRVCKDCAEKIYRALKL